MYSTIKDFLVDWQQESESTLKVLRALSDKSLSQKVTNEGRSLGFLAWHVVQSLGEMGGEMKLAVNTPKEDAPVPPSASPIASAYETSSRSFVDALQKSWNDKMLADLIDMYGEKWTRAGSLDALIKHQTHHRGQMTVLMRQAGLKVPGVYGPSKEEWAQMGMPAQE
jgi:uncharacterized damage-inducible protein DinB